MDVLVVWHFHCVSELDKVHNASYYKLQTLRPMTYGGGDGLVQI